MGSNFLCERPHGANPLPSACVHLSLAPPLRVDVINGWPLTQNRCPTKAGMKERDDANFSYDLANLRGNHKTAVLLEWCQSEVSINEDGDCIHTIQRRRNIHYNLKSSL